MGRLDGRVALVTGAARGMGAGHVAALVAEGAIVYAADVDAKEGRRSAEAAGAMFVHLDVTSEAHWTAATERAASEHGPITVLVNNAGIAGLCKVQDTSLEEWRRIMAVNLDGVFLGIRHVAGPMAAAGGGVIVNVSSDAGLIGMPHIAAYAASKWAVRGLTKAAALDLAPDDIRVLSLHPGIVRTPMAEGVDFEAIGATLPMQRVGTVDELSRMLLFMVVEATYSTGVEFVADGGHTMGIELPV
jgi:3alpha(or 20beta)-hydroxysteroid dehydrogenase